MQYVEGEYREYTEGVLLQMIGRAGRPQFDQSATAVIMTSASAKVSIRIWYKGPKIKYVFFASYTGTALLIFLKFQQHFYR